MNAPVASASASGLTPAAVLMACTSLGLSCDEALARSLAVYLSELEKWNRRINLVSPDTWPRMLELCADSWHLAAFLERLPGLPPSPRTLDLGAGAGLPGIPLRMLWHPGEYHLVEIRGKRAVFLRTVLGRLRLPGTHLFEGRAEDALSALTPVDIALSRAFMPWPRFLELVRPHLGGGGLALVMASEPPPELPELPDTAGGWRLAAAREYQAPGGRERSRWLWAVKAKV